MEMLRQVDEPRITAKTPWAEVAARVADDPRCEAVPEVARELMYETYVEAVAKLERARSGKAEGSFKVRRETLERIRREFKGLMKGGEKRYMHED
jgi:hypothetical protein